ncbi:zinc finger AN1 domain-containing stress-associated protein 12 [Cornus florida]|uniref:zinc finger AN1 domain-containing stress-associated protein 12 n=1 Tax=Cornus florida TaxID=4283 RepID=UPI00289AEA9D|nr:zinc finger AN1 domain-containing stress-associated protein 12 [Cornus florida]
MGGGTEAFPDLGIHCQLSECNQLDFLPFKCVACQKTFCLEHRAYKSHNCPKQDHNSRKVVVCEICSTSIETTGREGEDEKVMLERHEKSGDCDPKKKNKPTCAVRRCREILTFSNTSTCKTCQLKVCLKHRFPADHACKHNSSSSSSASASFNKEANKFLMALASRNANDCSKKGRESASPPSTPSVKAY